MKNILAFGASNSKNSINKVFASYVANKLLDANVNLVDLNNFELPLFGPDLEEKIGVPENANRFLELIKSSDAIVLSLAEYNGQFTTVFKNLFDWMSRIDQNIWCNKPMLLLSTSPGERGGASVMEATKSLLPYFGGNVISDFSFPSFYDNFQDGKIGNETLLKELDLKVKLLQEEL